LSWQLQDRGYRVRFEPWDVVAGSHVAQWRHETLAAARHVVPVLSRAYLDAPEIVSQWSAAIGRGPGPRLLPVKIDDCRPGGLLGDVHAVDLTGLGEDACREALFAGFDAVGRGHARPENPPPFPGPPSPSFPGPAAADAAAAPASGDAPEPIAVEPPVSLADQLLGPVRGSSSPGAEEPEPPGGARGAGESPGRRRRRPRRPLVVGVVALAVVLAVGSAAAVAVMAGGGDEAPTSENVTLQSLTARDAYAFMPPAGRNTPGVTSPLPRGGTVTAEVPGLFGGTRREGGCDRKKIVDFLLGHRERLDAWTGVLGVPPGGLDAYVDGLTPVVLRTDTLVTNHGFTGGKATPFPAVLQAGTAVLVDGTGRPVVKCSCGNPLTAPPAAPHLAYTGTPWPGFAARAVFRVAPVKVVVEVFVLRDVTGAGEFARERGTDGRADRDFVAAADADWRNTAYRVACGAAGGGVAFDVRDGAGRAAAGGRGYTLAVVGAAVGDLTRDGRPDVAVMLACRDAASGVGGVEVQVFRDGPNRLDTIVPPAFGEAAGSFAREPFDVDAGRLVTAADYADPGGPGLRRTLSWEWDGGRFVHRVDAEAAVPAPGTPGVRVRPGSDAVAVSVAAPADGGPVDRYEVAASNGGAASLDAPGTVTLRVSGCAVVSVTVTAVGPGGRTAAAPADAVGCVLPGPVVDLAYALVLDPGDIGVGEGNPYAADVTWKPPANAGGGTVEYVVTVENSFGTEPEQVIVTGTAHRVGCCSGRSPNTGVTVAARNEAGTGPARRVEFTGG
jgi:hypothetical protein